MNFAGSTFPLAGRLSYGAVFRKSTGHGNTRGTKNLAYVGPIICTYAVHNTITGQAYVGSSEDFYRRWNGHLADLRNGLHVNVLLQQAFDKYGEDAFTMGIIETYPTTDGLLKAEAVDALKHYEIEDLYNGRIGGIFSPHYPHGQINRHRKPTQRVGSQTKARWYHGETTL